MGRRVVTKRGVETAVLSAYRAMAEAGRDGEAGFEGVASRPGSTNRGACAAPHEASAQNSGGGRVGYVPARYQRRVGTAASASASSRLALDRRRTGGPTLPFRSHNWRNTGWIQAGIELTREQDIAKAEELAAWLDKVLTSYSVLPVDAAAFREWARLMHRNSDTLIEDAMIATTAKVHGLTVVTRNVRDFSQLGVAVQNPFDSP